MVSVVIENVIPELDCGQFPVKRIVGDSLEVRADIVAGDNEVVRAALTYRAKRTSSWSVIPMSLLKNDTWTGAFVMQVVGLYEYTIEAWVDKLSTLTRRIQSRANASEEVLLEIADLRTLMSSVTLKVHGVERSDLVSWSERIANCGSNVPKVLEILVDNQFISLMARYVRSTVSRYKTLEVVVDDKKAGFATWYEMFHRSQGRREGQSATFKDCENRLDEIRNMGFDTIYFPPVHPIGHTNRRGKNNAGPASESEPGSPWAIGDEQGGHTTINPSLGTMEDFAHFVDSARALGIDVALDLAFQCSPDHPYVKEHPDWFLHRSDGSIRYAENPPKKYLDIYPLNFDTDNSNELWHELFNIVLFWINKGIRVFRVDNPHTKPIAFWRWLIREIKQTHPETIFLAEAFTRPKLMKYLAKLGFTESYTYFAWKNSKQELEEFLKEFVLSDVSEYYRGNLFANTPDILTEFLQKGGRPAFKIRLVLAATLSSIYGIYNGYELCENRAKAAGSEEYLDSEKYQYKVWDWDRPGNIKEFIRKINAIRRENPSLQQSFNLHLLRSDNNNILFFGKWNHDLSNVILVAVNLDPFASHDSTVIVPTQELRIDTGQTYLVRDLITDSVYKWKGESNYVKLDPAIEPAHILLLERK